MMFKGLKKSTSKITAAVLAAVMILTMIPFGTLVNAFAATVDSYTVTLTDGSAVIGLDDVQITLTDKEDNSNSFTQGTVNGVATFENSVEDGKTYTVSVAEIIGYEAVNDFEVTPNSDKTNDDVNLVAIDKVELKGTVVDENGNPYNGATVKVTGYITETAVTGYDGTYSFSAYKGKDYTVTATAKEEKYEKASTEITNLSETQPASELRFKVKEFKITTSATDSNGLVTDSDNVKYGENKTITATAKDGYCINSFKVDGVEQLDATAKKDFTYSFSNITDSHSVSVSFKRQTYKISFTVDENGKVEYTEGTKQVVAGGSVNIDKEFNESEDPSNPTKVIVDAIPNDTYRVSKIVVDGVEQTFTENDKKVEGTEFAMTEDHTFVVEFKLNQYDININNGSGKEGEVTVLGSSNSNNAKANHGDNLEFQIKNIQGYVIKEIKVNNAITDYEYDNDKAAYVVAVNNVDGNIDFDISYEINDKLYSFKENVKVEIKNGAKSVVFNDGTTELDSLGELNNNNTDGLVIKTEGNTIVLKSGSEIVFTNKNNKNIELQFVYSQFSTNSNGWYNPRNKKVTVSKSCELTNVQVKPNDKNTINPKDAIKASEQPIKYTIIIDNNKPEASLTKSEFDWTNADNVTVTGTVSDENTAQNPSSGLSHIVWSKDSAMTPSKVLGETENKAAITNGEFSFNSVNGEQNSTYYVYAVDVAGNVSDAKTVEVKIDKTAPTVDTITKVPNREWTKENTTIKGSVSDLNSTDGNLASGVKRVVYTTNNSLTNDEIKALGTENEAILKNGEYSFELKDSQTATYYIYAIDNAGNVSDCKSINVKITRVVPIIDSVEKEPSKEWHNDDVKVTVSASIENGASPINRVVYTTSTDLNNAAILALDTTAVLENGKYIFTVSKDVEQNQKYYVYAIDEADNISEAKSIDIRIDTTIPTVDGFIFERVNSSAPAKILNFLTFGLFFNEEIRVVATVSDGIDIDDSQCNNVKFQLYSGTAAGTPYGDAVVVNIEDNTATTTIPMNFKGVIKAVAYDNAGNASIETMATNKNSNSGDDKFADGFIMTEIMPSNVTFNETAPIANSKNWYNSKDITIPFDVTDETNGIVNSGLYSIEVKAYYNQSEDEYQTVTFNDDLGIDNNAIEAVMSRQIDLTFGTDADDIIAYQGDGQYKLSVLVTDNCGNTRTEEITYFVDTTAANIVSFELGKNSEGVVEEADYGYYFKNDVDVIVTVNDNIEDVKDVSDACEVRYYTVDYSVPDSPVYSGTTTENYTVAEYDSNKHQAIIPIRGNFKGQIYAWVIDNADNTSIKAYDGTSIDPAKPDGSILEPIVKHESEEHIAFAKNNTSFATRSGSELYATDVPVTITITDTYSGIREIEWEVVAPYDTENNQSGKVTVNNDKSIAEGSDSDWKQTKSEANLVTEMEKTITVNNNSNDIVVKVKMMDRAGNTSEKEITFSIDKTKPVIEVTYDNNVPDDTYKDIYKENRTATIKVTERNFDSKDIVYQITNTDGVIPTLSDWKETENPENPDETYNIATISYTADGDYTFDISYSDLAKNAADKFAQHAFTIDKTMPTVTVTYDNNSALNGNYYKADRTATITIVEHNFDSARVNVIGTATDNGTNLSFPATSSWTDNGDTHIATINYSFDSQFTFDIEFSDMAGNPIADYTAEEFFVDKTAPTLEISGVEDKSANNGTVAPIVTYTDTNFNKDAVTIELNGVNNGKVNYAASTKDIDNGQEYAYADFDKVQEVDDIYTLSATLTDKAGNETKKEIMFSANRFGSVYTFDTYLKNIEGKYTNAEQDVVFTETNVDTLDHESILLKLFKDGTPTDLKEGQDYTVAHTGGDGKWSQYEYVVSKELFANDGKYRMTVYSKDRAGNVNENIEESKKAEISFGIDKTKPVIVPIDFESGKQYPVEVKTVKAEIKDNLVLENVKIYLGEEKAENEIKYTVDGETYTFDIPQSNEKQTVLFVATDAASNEYKLSVEDFLVSTNIFVRWYNNTPLFIGSIIGVVVLAVGLAAFLIFGKKKKKDDEDEKEKF